MSRKADPSSRRSPRRRNQEGNPQDPHLRPKKEPAEVDSDFGICLALAPALRRRTDT